VIVLDTNVVSELMRKAPEPSVVSWVDQFSPLDVLITAVTAAELRYGVGRLPEGRRKRELHIKLEGLLTEDFSDQILPFDALATVHYADLVVSRELAGSPISMADGQIAAICRTWSAGLATRNIADFVDTGVEAINPWTATSG
jgi:toxin FitB